MDVVDPATRSKMMAAIRGSNTRPELLVRRFLHAHGYRFRIHRKDLPGKPDIVLPKLRTCIFVHGCFWHRHLGCRYATTPKTRQEFWDEKFLRNVARDAENIEALKNLGWQVVIVWECQLRKDGEGLLELLHRLRTGSKMVT
ncbi:very short patch repair endonuclease [Pseudomonas sp. NA-150]|uniref:very short patch repair endonuclease n=1 Tax=Pseudomonas sp. NA-150 TaxID=3367525 RepID=UPI0037CA66E9